MYLFRIAAVVYGVLIAQSAFSQSTEKWNLERCIQYALQNNVQVKQAAVSSGISANENLQSKLNLLPSVDGAATFSNNFGNGFNPQTYNFAEGNSQSFQLSLQANLPLWTGLQQIFNIQRTKYELLASKFDYDNAKNNMILAVASGYLQVLLNKEIVKVAQKQKELTQSQMTMVKGRITAGSLPQSAVYDVESQAARDEVAIVNSQNAVTIALLALKQLLQLPGTQAFDIESPEVQVDNLADVSALSSQAIFDYALNTQPVIKSADARIKSAMMSRKISYGALSPTISAFAGLSSGYFSQDQRAVAYDTLFGMRFPSKYEKTPFNNQFENNFRKVVGVSLNVPLFSRGQKILNIQNAKLQMQIRELQLESARNQLRSDIEQAYANAKAAAQTYLANQTSQTSAQKAYESLEGRYRAGMASIFDVQQAQNNVTATQSQMVQAKYTYIFRLKILDFYQGKAITLN